MIKQNFNHGDVTSNVSRTLAASVIFAAICFLTSFVAVPAHAATGTMNINGIQVVADLTVDGTGTDWTWTASTATLTLDNSYTGYTRINCQSTDDITLVYTGDIAITGVGYAVNCQGNLTISGSGGVLTLTGGSGSNVLNVEGALQISGGSVSAGGGYCGVYAKNGLTVSGAANLTANATETNGYGIETYDGNVVISTTGTVSAGGTGTGFAVNARKSGFLANGLFSVSGGTVTLTNSDNPANLISGGLNHTGGTLNTYAAGAFPGGSVTIASDLAGGAYAGNGKGASGSLDYYDHSTYAYASGNALTVTSGSFTGTPSFSGGHSNRAGEHANGNSITVNGGDFSGATAAWINGGQLDNPTGGEANDNTVVVTNFTGTVTTVSGGNGFGSASGNTVSISGGDSINYVYGGNCGSGNATGNAVTLIGGTFTGNIYGAFAMYDATGNTVTIEAGATLDAGVTLYGGSSSSGNAVTGNILNLKKSGVAIRMLGNFVEYNFTLPASITAGSTVITASDGYNGASAIDIAGITVGLAFDGAPSLAVGNKITLIDGGTNGVTGAPATTSLTASGYDFTIAVESNKLVATVTAAPPTYTATLNIYMDNSPHSNDGTTYTLKLAGNETTTATMTGEPGATRTASVPNGTWKVYPYGNEYTGVNIVINDAPGDARFDQYTGSYSVSPQGAATGGTFGAAITGIGGGSYNIDFSTLPASFYYKGDAVTFTATGEGAAGYTYAWSGTHGGTQISGTSATYTIPSVTGTINLTCTITGTGTAPTITTTTLPNGTVGVAYSQTLAATGTTPVTWSLDSGALPGGLTISSAGVISGIPTTAETATFIVKAANGVSPDATKSLSITVNSVTYGVSIGSFSGGSVSADKYSAAEGETVTLTLSGITAGYELASIAAHKTDDENIIVSLYGSGRNNGATYTFTMPAYGVMVMATFDATQAPPDTDAEAVAAAKAAIEGGTYRVAQATANDVSGVKAWLVSTLNLLFNQSHNIRFRSAGTSVDAVVNITSVTSATAGTEAMPAGADGAFSFAVSLSKGASSAIANVSTGLIVAIPYDSTPVKNMDAPQSQLLRAYVQNGALHISGLTPGKSWSLYSLSGALVYQSIAKSEAGYAILPARGVYIVMSEKNVIKVMY